MQRCPKCNYVRTQQDTAPEWQCPACHIAYAKVAEPARASSIQASVTGSWQPRPDKVSTSVIGSLFSPATLFSLIGLIGAVYLISYLFSDRSEQTVDPVAVQIGEGRPPVVMYTTSWCPNCKAAEQYLSSNHIDYVAYDIEKSAQAKDEFRRLNGRGIPLVVVRGHRLKEGFNSDKVLAFLNEKN